MNYFIVLDKYEPGWPEMFNREKSRLLNAITPWVVAIEHIGSTAVPGLSAKPIIDIMVGIHSLEDAPTIILKLEKLGYIYKIQYQDSIPERRFLYRINRGGHTHHLHMVEAKSDYWYSHLLFRDFLRSHPHIAADYAELKYHLANEYPDDVDSYTYGKSDFVASVLHQASVWDAAQHSQSDQLTAR